MTFIIERYFMKTYDNLWDGLCSIENLFQAYRKARKRKTLKPYVLEFERDLSNNLLLLHSELVSKSYHPKPLINFTVREPKTRKISKSDFRDRIVHHALCNVIEPIFEKTFLHDSYANRIGKGALKAIERFDEFKRKVSKNNRKECYVLKADIRHYFETVNHGVLITLLKKRIHDKNIMWLINKILKNYSVGGGASGFWNATRKPHEPVFC